MIKFITNKFKFYGKYKSSEYIKNFFNSRETQKIIDEILAKKDSINSLLYLDAFIAINALEVVLHDNNPNYKFSKRWFDLNEIIIRELEKSDSIDAKIRAEYWKILASMALMYDQFQSSDNNKQEHFNEINSINSS